MNQEFAYYKQMPSAFLQSSCILCGGKDLKAVTTEQSKLMGAGNIDVQKFHGVWIQLLECKNCSFGFTKEMPVDPDFFDKRYDIRFNPDDEAKNTFKDAIIDTLFEDLKKVGCNGGKLLDIGSFAGVFIRHAQKRGFTAQGIEVNQTMAKHSKDVQKLDVIHGKFLDTDLPKNHYDLITLIDVLEHLRSPQLSLKKCFEHLKPGGLLLIKVPNFHSQLYKQKVANFLGISSLGIFEGFGHINHFSPKSLSLVLESIGFEVVRDYVAASETWPSTGIKNSMKNIFRRFVTSMFILIKNVTGKNFAFNFTIIARKK